MELVTSTRIEKNTPAPESSLADFRIKASDNIKADVYVSKIGNTNKFSKGNISAWTGAAKSRKTFGMTMVVASMLGGIDLYNQFYSYDKNKVLWIDTEQSPFDVQKVTRRLKQFVGTEANLIMYGLRPLTPAQRLSMIEQALKENKCDVLVIDGARDLLMNINDPEQGTIIVTKLMEWSYNYNIHVATVVHSSQKGVRGHLGTELENKAETVIKIQVNENDKERSDIIEVKSRGKGFQDIAFKVNDKGLPEVLDSDMMNDFLPAMPGQSKEEKEIIPF